MLFGEDASLGVIQLNLSLGRMYYVHHLVGKCSVVRSVYMYIVYIQGFVYMYIDVNTGSCDLSIIS